MRSYTLSAFKDRWPVRSCFTFSSVIHNSGSGSMEAMVCFPLNTCSFTHCLYFVLNVVLPTRTAEYHGALGYQFIRTSVKDVLLLVVACLCIRKSSK